MSWLSTMTVLAALGSAGWIVWKINSPKHRAISCIHCGECVRAGYCVLKHPGPAPQKTMEKSADIP